MPSPKVFENRLRRMAERQGYRLAKSRRRDPRAFDYGGYMLIEPRDNVVVFGAWRHAYEATLEQIEDFLLGRTKAERKLVGTRKRS